MTDLPAKRRLDSRRHQRNPAKTYADLHWESRDRGMLFARAYCLDVSDGGLRLRLPGGGPPVGTSLSVRIDAFGFTEFGVVRYAHPSGILGVEFRFEGAAREQLDRWRKVVRSLHP